MFCGSPQNYFGYDISDYRAIDPDHGTMEDIEDVLSLSILGAPFIYYGE
jgi:glycosidase